MTQLLSLNSFLLPKKTKSSKLQAAISEIFQKEVSITMITNK